MFVIGSSVMSSHWPMVLICVNEPSIMIDEWTFFDQVMTIVYKMCIVDFNACWWKWVIGWSNSMKLSVNVMNEIKMVIMCCMILPSISTYTVTSKLKYLPELNLHWSWKSNLNISCCVRVSKIGWNETYYSDLIFVASTHKSLSFWMFETFGDQRRTDTETGRQKKSILLKQ